MLVFVCETVTGGGLVDANLPTSLISEGTLMRDTLIGDIEDLPGVRVITTHDARLPPPPRGTSTPVHPGDSPWTMWGQLAGETDCCWPIAPETDGLLERLAQMLRARNSRVIACDDTALRDCASKARTAAVLERAGIAIVPTWRQGEVPSKENGPFVLKPDGGAGAMGVRIVPQLPTEPLPGNIIVQPFIEGTPASLSLLCQGGRTYVLAANEQHIENIDGHLHFNGLTVGGLPIDETLRALGEKVGAAFPGLHGIVGLDYIATAWGPVVVEINPRLTTSYAGLRRSLGVNPTAFVAELIRDGTVPDLPHMPMPVAVEVML